MAELASNVLPATNRAVRIVLSEHVQGVGFRPFVYRLAQQHGINGRVQNQMGEVEVIAVGSENSLQQFQQDLIQKAPPLSRPNIDTVRDIEDVAFDCFEIAPSSTQADARIFVPQDLFMCDDCRRELQDVSDRRFQYPFINCTQCGPRYTLIEALPYDRANTSMAGFPLCAECSNEYLDPGDRRFHAEPVACPTCGPQLSFHDRDDASLCTAAAALDRALDALKNGKIVAVKGIGGYHLMCDARNQSAVVELRHRKQRPAKPLAVMFPLAGDDGPARLVFKQSPTCPTSRAAQVRFERFAEGCPDGEVDLLYRVDVVASRDVARKIADDTGVRHESPQVLLIGPGGKILWHTSHYSISEDALAEATQEAGW